MVARVLIMPAGSVCPGLQDIFVFVQINVITLCCVYNYALY